MTDDAVGRRRPISYQDLAGAEVSQALAEDLLASARWLDDNAFLRRTLSDPGHPVGARQRLVDDVFADQVAPTALAVLRHQAGLTWPDGESLARSVEGLGLRAVWLWADRQGLLTEVVDELFAFGQLMAREPELRAVVTDFNAAPERRRGLIEGLLGAHARPATLALAEHAALTQHSTLEDALERDLDLAAELAGAVIAVARVAVPLPLDQRARLLDVLTRRAGRKVLLQELIDPAILGGVRVELGDDVIDGSLLAGLASARRGLT
ncbi:MAG: F0F1 ATP synthase subunit delta [Propionibacteriaceae bacterium]|jgi:F-type H+-transporting ATPase subunit delta|nr:F0F1 ATP synthase subunit delta [Propionibacteriaceae bacterium]